MNVSRSLTGAFVGTICATVACIVLLGAQTGEVLRNSDVVTMQNAGLSAELIVLKIDTSATQFDTSADALSVLKAVGVADPVIAAMVKASIRSDRPNAAPVSTNGPLGGIQVRTEPLTPVLKQQYSLNDRDTSTSAAVVTDVLSGSPAAEAGIRVGDVIWGIVNGEGAATIQTEEQFSRAVRLCPTDCLAAVFHSDGQTKNGFVPLGPVENSFVPLFRPAVTPVAGYKSRRSTLVVKLAATTKDDMSWFFKQTFGDDDKHPHAGALAVVSPSGTWLWVTAGGAKAPIIRLDQTGK